MRNSLHRKAFTMLELTFVLATIASMAIIQHIYENREKEQLAKERTAQEIVQLVEASIFNKDTGYTTHKGGYCASDYTVKNISAYRVKNCSKLNGFNVVEITSSEESRKDGSQSYFSLLENYAEGISQAGIEVYIDDESDYISNILIKINTDDKARMEFYIANTLQDDLKSKFVSKDHKAVSFDDNSFNGTTVDGIIKMSFKN